MKICNLLIYNIKMPIVHRVETKIFILLLFIFFGCNPEYPKTEKLSFIIGEWQPKDTSYPTSYVFNKDGSGKEKINKHWYDITYTLEGQILKTTWSGRTKQYWLYDQTNIYFMRCMQDQSECMGFDKK